MINACNTVIFWHFLTRKWTVLSTTTLPYMPRVDFYDRRSKVARERKKLPDGHHYCELRGRREPVTGARICNFCGFSQPTDAELKAQPPWYHLTLSCHLLWLFLPIRSKQIHPRDRHFAFLSKISSLWSQVSSAYGSFDGSSQTRSASRSSCGQHRHEHTTSGRGSGSR